LVIYFFLIFKIAAPVIVPIRRAVKVSTLKIDAEEGSRMHPNMSPMYMERIAPTASSRRILPAVLLFISITFLVG
jgi:hypothetical protein